MKRKIAVLLSALMMMIPASSALGAEFSSGTEDAGIHEVMQADAFFGSDSTEVSVTPDAEEPVFEVQDPETPDPEVPDADVSQTDSPDENIPGEDTENPDDADADDAEIFTAADGDAVPADGENPDEETPDEETPEEPEEKTDISACSVKVASSVTYTGAAAVPAVTVSKDGQALVKDQDYTLEYLNNTDIGNAKVKITGIGKYEGTAEKGFKIILGVPKLKTVSSAGYNSVKVTWTAVPGADSYIVFYKGNTIKKYTRAKSGVKGTSFVHTSSKLVSGKTYTYTVKAVRNGVLSKANDKGKNVKPIPAAPKLGKVQSAAYNQLKISWSKVAGASGYYVYRKSGSSWKRVGTTTGTSFIHKSSTSYPVKTGTTYTYTVKAYRKVGSSKVLGAGNNTGISGRALPNKPVLVKASCGTALGQIVLTWKKASGATHYLIYRKDDNGKWQKIATVKGVNTLSYTHKSSEKYPIVSGKTYTYTVCSYNSNGKTKGTYDTKGLKVKGPTQDDLIDGKVSKKAQSILAKITTSKMTKAQKLSACWRYVTSGSNFSYWPKYPTLTKTDWQKECALDMLTTGKGNCYSFACAFAALASEIGYSPNVICGRVSGTRDGASDGMTRHCWVTIGGAYYDPEAQFAGWYKGVYGSGSYDIAHTIQKIVPFR